MPWTSPETLRSSDAEELEAPHLEELDFAGDAEELETAHFGTLDLA